MAASTQNPEATEAGPEDDVVEEETPKLGADLGYKVPEADPEPVKFEKGATPEEREDAEAAAQAAADAEVEAFRAHLLVCAERGEVLPYRDGENMLIEGYYVTNPEGKAYITAIEPAKRIDSALAMGEDVYVFGEDSEFCKLYVDPDGEEVEIPEPEVSQTPPSDEQLAEQAEAREKAAEEAANPPEATQLPADKPKAEPVAAKKDHG